MKDPKNLTIATLCITAVILMLGLVMITTRPAVVQAGEVSSYGGDFTVTVGGITRDTEMLYIIDNTTQRLLVYGINRANGKAVIADKAELAVP
jgi:hypothetical protein